MKTPQPRIAVVGGASVDLLHFQGQTVQSIGGAGLYTALAAHRAGAQVTMFAPRPDPLPPSFVPVVERIAWIGPPVPLEDLPSFEIAHYGGGRSAMLQARWGAEADLSPSHLPPEGLPGEFVHVVPFHEPARQLAFLRHFKALGCRVAAGTYACAIAERTGEVQEALAMADVFFCNEQEAESLFGCAEAARVAPGQLLYITRGPRGAWVVQGDHRTEVPGVPVEELDPTGAGDTFCGTVLAFLAQGWHPVEAARWAAAAAAEMITAVGPTALLRPPPSPAPPEDGRVRVDPAQVERIAARIAQAEEAAPFPFVGEDFPPPGHPYALDFFFASTLQQFGFWEDDGKRYLRPMVARLRGRDLKGSDYLWAAYRRWLEADPDGLTPPRQARLEGAELAHWFQDDAGANPVPAFGLRLDLARAYGRDMGALGPTPADLVTRANASPSPLGTFLAQLDHIGGYKEDPLRKKSVLLAVILQQRPERFLRSAPEEPVPPIIDYHLQRSCLRTGLVEVLDPDLRRKLVERRFLQPDEEWAVRRAAHAAIQRLQAASGKSMGAVDWFFFGARRRCPEMMEPDCPRCPVDPSCAHRKDFFQPVFRTTFY